MLVQPGGLSLSVRGLDTRGGYILRSGEWRPDADGGFCRVAERGRCAHLGNVS